MEQHRLEEEDYTSNGHNADGQVNDTAQLVLIDAIFNTTRERILELTNIPLDKQRALTWMKVYVKEVFALCDEIVKAQKALSKHYAKYHNGVEPEVEWLDKWDGKIKSELISLMDEWIYRYCQVRRSKDGEHIKDAVVLSRFQMETMQAEGGESPFDKLVQQ